MTEDELTPNPTMLSDFIAELEKIRGLHGNIPVGATGWDYRTGYVSAWVEENYWDGGILYPTKSWKHWIRSKTARTYPYNVIIHAHGPEAPMREFDKDEDRPTIDGEPMEWWVECPHCQEANSESIYNGRVKHSPMIMKDRNEDGGGG